MTSAQYLSWNALGLFPLPEEDEQEFCSRVEMLLACAKPVDPKHERGLQLVDALYGARPSWVPVVCHNQGLALWEAACTWYSETPPLVQISPRLERSALLSKLYSYSEVLAHEYVHAIRYALNSSFDEFFAYFTTKDSLRAQWSALFASPREVLVLLASLFLPSILLIFDFLWGAACSLFAPVAFIAWYGFRTWQKRKVWQSCLHNLQQLLGNSRSYELFVRLTDSEIMLFSERLPHEIEKWIMSAAREEFRWKVFSTCYFGTMQK